MALEQRHIVCAYFLSRYEDEPFSGELQLDDEKCVLYNNIVRKKQWLRPSLTIKKVLVFVRWYFSGFVHYYLLEPGKTATATVYCE